MQSQSSAANQHDVKTLRRAFATLRNFCQWSQASAISTAEAIASPYKQSSAWHRWINCEQQQNYHHPRGGDGAATAEEMKIQAADRYWQWKRGYSIWRKRFRCSRSQRLHSVVAARYHRYLALHELRTRCAESASARNIVMAAAASYKRAKMSSACALWRRIARLRRESRNLASFGCTRLTFRRWLMAHRCTRRCSDAMARASLRFHVLALTRTLLRWYTFSRARAKLKRALIIFRCLNPYPSTSIVGLTFTAWRHEYLPREKRLRAAARALRSSHRSRQLSRCFECWEMHWRQPQVHALCVQAYLRRWIRRAQDGERQWNSFKWRIFDRVRRLRASQSKSERCFSDCLIAAVLRVNSFRQLWQLMYLSSVVRRWREGCAVVRQERVDMTNMKRARELQIVRLVFAEKRVSVMAHIALVEGCWRRWLSVMKHRATAIERIRMNHLGRRYFVMWRELCDIHRLARLLPSPIARDKSVHELTVNSIASMADDVDDDAMAQMHSHHHYASDQRYHYAPAAVLPRHHREARAPSNSITDDPLNLQRSRSYAGHYRWRMGVQASAK